MKTIKKILGLLLCMLLLDMLATLWSGKGATTRDRIKPGMTVSEVLHTARGWLVLNAVPAPRPQPEAVVHVRPNALEVQGMGEQDGTFRFADETGMAGALEKLMRGKVWKLTFGYVAVPRREYFDVNIDATGKVASVSAVRPGKLD